MPELSRAALRRLLLLMCASLALVIGATSSLAVAQPTIATALDASQTQLTWIVNVYVVVFAALLLPAGIATDRFGRRSTLAGGVLVFAAASLASGYVGSPGALILLRAVAGIGAAAVMPATLSVLTDAYPDDRREQAVAVWAAVSGAGALVGVLAAGLLLHAFWWGSVQVVYGAAGLLLVPALLLVVPDHRDRSLSLDPVGSALAVIALGSFTYAVTEAPDRGWAAARTFAPLLLGMAAACLFVVVESRGRAPLLEVRLFRERGLAAGSLLVLLVSLSAFGFFLLGPQFLQIADGYDALGAAVRLLPFALGIAPASALVPQLIARFGPRTVAAGSAGTVGTAFLLLAATATSAYWHFAVCLIVFAAGFGGALTVGTSLIIAGLPADRRTLASAVNDVTREVGGAVGAAVLSTVLLTHYRNALPPLPPGLARQARQGAGQALAEAASAGPAGKELASAAIHGFTGGYQLAMVVGGLLLLATAVLVGIVAPQRDHVRVSTSDGTKAAADEPESSSTDPVHA